MLRTMPRLLVALLAIVVLALAPTHVVGAQPGGVRLTFASRAQIDSMARAAEDAAATAAANLALRDTKTAEAAMLRQRLTQGDFAVGDRIIVRVEGQATLSDTFAVRDGNRLMLPGIDDIALQGVLRSELEGRVRTAVAAYFRDPTVRVVPLLRVLVRGGVMRPGYYALPADLLLSDAIMAAGGPSPISNVHRSQLKRGDKRVYDAKAFARLVQDGYSLDQAHLRPGDELVVGEKIQQNWAAIFQAGAALTGIVTLVYTFRNR